MFAVSIPRKPTPQSTRTLAAAFVTPGFSKRYAGVRRRRSHQPVRRRTASPFCTGFRKSRRADRRCSGRIAPFAGRPRRSSTCPGAMNRSRGTSSSVRPLGSKWNGASTWVPVWVTMNIDSARKPWASRVVHWVKVGGGYAGNIGVLGPIDWERSTMRENRADRLRGAMGPTGRGTAARRRPRPRGPRRQPDGARVHRGPQRGLAVSGLAPRGVREPADRDLPGRWPRAPRLLHRRRYPMRPACEQTDPCGVRPVPAVSGAGSDAPPELAGRRGPWRRRDGALPPGVAGNRTRGSHPGPEVPPWGALL